MVVHRLSERINYLPDSEALCRTLSFLHHGYIRLKQREFNMANAVPLYQVAYPKTSYPKTSALVSVVLILPVARLVVRLTSQLRVAWRH